jgi:hypothetical protein
MEAKYFALDRARTRALVRHTGTNDRRVGSEPLVWTRVHHRPRAAAIGQSQWPLLCLLRADRRH